VPIMALTAISWSHSQLYESLRPALWGATGGGGGFARSSRFSLFSTAPQLLELETNPEAIARVKVRQSLMDPFFRWEGLT